MSASLARGSAVAGAALAGIVAHDLRQRRHAIVRNFPVIGHFRYLLESVGPELRQYIVTSNDEERRFSRDQRRWVYASAKRELNTFGFGSDNEMEQIDSLVVFKHSPFPAPAPAEGQAGAAPDYRVAAGKVLGGAHGRARAFRPASLANVSGMRYGSLSPVAVEALNRGAALDLVRIEIVSQRYGSAPMSEVFGYETGWPVLSGDRRAEIEELIGAAAPVPPPGPEAGEHAGFPGAGDPSRRHMDARSVGGATREGG